MRLALPLLLLLGACAPVADQPPVWRRPDPSAAEPQLRWRVPDDGHRDHLVGAPAPYSAAAAKNLFFKPFWFS